MSGLEGEQGYEKSSFKSPSHNSFDTLFIMFHSIAFACSNEHPEAFTHHQWS